MISHIVLDQEMGRHDFCSVVNSPDTSEVDVCRAADVLIERHGAEAEIAAERIVYQMLDRGDRDGLLVWMRVKCAIAKLQVPRRRPAH